MTPASDVQKDHEAFKAEASKRSIASQEECSKLRDKADAADQEAAKLRQKVQQIEESNQNSAVTQATSLAKTEVPHHFTQHFLVCPAHFRVLELAWGLKSIRTFL